MIIKNGLLFQENGAFVLDDLHLNQTTIIPASACHGTNEIIDATGLYVIPGLIDVHIHGAMGYDFCDGNPTGLMKISAYLKQNGITSFCPTSMTLPTNQLQHIFSTITNIPEESQLSHIQGIHMEGPFISPKKKGAQKEDFIQNPNIECFEELNTSCGNRIRLITIAPELEGSNAFIKKMHPSVNISLGHSGADYETARQAFSNGASHVTHLFNAMLPFNHRNPGIVGAALDDETAMVELICDGIHIHPSVIRSVFKLFSSSRVILVSDAMRACGMPDGTYELGGQRVEKNGKHAVLSNGTLAGSVTNLMDCMRNAVSFGIPLSDAITACTKNPAKSIGIFDKVGSLTPGKAADIVLLDKELNIVRVL
ncbi:MAG: N-acetylglucosamine-6-phosphate deacetylase [Velocimicrobium sp.]